MKVIIAGDGDHIGRKVGQASLADDVEGLRRISQDIDRGNKIWESWVTMNGGSMISYGGDEFRAEILAEKLVELPKMRDQYAQTVGSSVSIGVGTKLSEADRALMVAKLRGGDKIVLYTSDLEPEIAQAMKQGQQRSEADKLGEEYLEKADPPAPEQPQPPAMVEGTAAGFKGASPPTAPTVDAPAQEASEHSQGETAQAMMENDNPAPPETTASADIENTFHQLAQDQDQKDQGQGGGGDAGEQLKAQVVQVLQALKAQAPILEQIKQSAPDTYKAVMDMAMAVIMMAKQLNNEPEHTSAKEVKDRSQSQAQVEVPIPPEEQEESSGKDKEKSKDTKKSEQDLEKAGFRQGRPFPTTEPGAKRIDPQMRQAVSDHKAKIASDPDAAVYADAMMTHGYGPEVPPPLEKLRVRVREPEQARYRAGLQDDLNEVTGGVPGANRPQNLQAQGEFGEVMQDAAGANSQQNRKLGITPEFKLTPWVQESIPANVRNHGPGSERWWRNPEWQPGDHVYAIQRFGDGTEPAGVTVYHGPPGNRYYGHSIVHRDEPGHVGDPEAGVPHGFGGYDYYMGLTKGESMFKTETDSGKWHDCDDFGHAYGTGETGDYCVMCGQHRDQIEQELDKASLSPGKPPAEHHHLNLPSGSKIDPGPTATRNVGRIKVTHPDTGKQSWIQARAGQVMSQDGHAISSRNPGGK